MSMTASLNRGRQSLSEFWNARNPRERTMIAAATAVVLLGLIYALLLDPAISGRERLASSLPALRQQSAQLQALSKEATGLAPAEAPPPVAPLSKETLESALGRKGLKAQNVAVTNDTARLQLPSVSFAGLLDWIDDMQKTSALSVAEANIVALGQPDTVNATLTLRQRKSE